MQMMLMVFRTSMAGEALPWVEQEQLPYTRLDGAQGAGATGTMPGSVWWGGANSVLLLAISDDRVSSFRVRVQTFKRELEVQQRVDVPFHIFVMPCLQWLYPFVHPINDGSLYILIRYIGANNKPSTATASALKYLDI